MKEIDRLSAAVDEFADAMKKRLYEKHKKGYRGWENADQDKLTMRAKVKTFAIEHDATYDIPKNCIDAANLLMMIWRRNK
jgi:hypothetical protein